MARITTPFDRDSTAEDVARGVDLADRSVIVTGAASGIGVETARALAGTGAKVTLAVRNVEAGEVAARDIVATSGNADVRVARIDLEDRNSIASFVAAWRGPLHALVANAGIMALPELELTSEGWERQFATNHLGHFSLALGLHEALAADGAARIVSVSSSGHRLSPIVFDDIHFEHRPYDPWSAYGQSKTANVLFAVEATRRWAGDGITANALMPGGIWTNLQRHVDAETRAGWAEAERKGRLTEMKTPAQGAATSTLLAASPDLNGIGGRYFEDCAEAEVVEDENSRSGVRAYALDPAAAEELWGRSLEMFEATTG